MTQPQDPPRDQPLTLESVLGIYRDYYRPASAQLVMEVLEMPEQLQEAEFRVLSRVVMAMKALSPKDQHRTLALTHNEVVEASITAQSLLARALDKAICKHKSRRYDWDMRHRDVLDTYDSFVSCCQRAERKAVIDHRQAVGKGEPYLLPAQPLIDMQRALDKANHLLGRLNWYLRGQARYRVGFVPEELVRVAIVTLLLLIAKNWDGISGKLYSIYTGLLG